MSESPKYIPPKFESDIDIDNRLLISSNPEGYIKRIK